MQTISNHVAQTEQSQGTTVIIDVREPSEYKERHIPGALNHPSTSYSKEEFAPFEREKDLLDVSERKSSKKGSEEIGSRRFYQGVHPGTTHGIHSKNLHNQRLDG